MADKIDYKKDRRGRNRFPITHEKAVRDSNWVRLEEKLNGIAGGITGKQETLVSGENIKTIGGQSVLGAGNIPISDPDAVKKTAQTLTAAEKAQILANIGGASAESVAAETARATAAEEDIMDAVDGTNAETVAVLPAASASTVGKFYYVGPDGNGEYARYRGIESGGSYSFIPVGTTQMALSDYATNSEVSQLRQEVTGDISQLEAEVDLLVQPADIKRSFTATDLVNVGVYNKQGNVVSNSDYGYSAPVLLESGQTIRVKGVGTSYPYLVVCQQDGTYIGYKGSSTGTDSIYTFTADEDVYIRVQGRLDSFAGAIYVGNTIREDIIAISERETATSGKLATNVKKFASTRGATYTRSEANNTIKVVLNTLYVYDAVTDTMSTINDNTEYTLSSQNRFLVLKSNGQVSLRTNSSNIYDTDFILLQYDSDASSKDMSGGALYTDYVKKTKDAEIAEISGGLSEVNSKLTTVQKQVKKYVSMRGAVYTRNRTANNITLAFDNLYVYDVDANSVTNIANNTTWTLTGVNGRFFVLTSSGTLALRANTAALQASDFILLYYDDNNATRDIVGGALYPDYIKRRLMACEESVAEIEAAQDVVKAIPENLGQVNCVRKAKQMASVKWTPKNSAYPIPYNTGTFPAGVEQMGMIYSSAKEYTQFIFEDVSLETFMTAVNNPRSVLYTENISAVDSRSVLGRVYHGVNCAAYYGSVCSGLLTFAYGLPVNVTTYEFRNWDRMEVIEDQTPYGLTIGDAVWQSGHIQLVTGITKNKYGVITNIEIVENAAATTKIKNYTTADLQDYIDTYNCVLLRYKYLYENRDYTPLTDFVAVEDEVMGSYNYNDDICPNYGNKSCYNEGDDVVLNLRTDYAAEGFETLEVYKDDVLHISRSIAGQDETLTGLVYGDYKARITGAGVASEYVFFKVVNAVVTKDGDSFEFSSANATPLYYEFCDLQGRRSYTIVGLSTHEFSDAELLAGEATPSGQVVSTGDYHYLKVHFKTAYGRVIKVIDWTA